MVQALTDLKTWRGLVQESIEVNRQMVEVGEKLLVALRWVAVGAKWIATVGAAFGVMFAALKWLRAL